MDTLALDASIAMTWCYPDEQSDYAYRVLEALAHGPAVVPAHWRLEVEMPFSLVSAKAVSPQAMCCASFPF
jgi:hypothetical protein